MGHGCYYTNDLTGDKAGFIDISLKNRDEDEGFLDFAIEDIADILSRCGYEQDEKDNFLFSNKLFKLNLVQNYHNLILYFNSLWSEYNYYSGKLDPRYILAKANLHRTELKIWKALMKEGYEIRIADSGYTSRSVVL